MEKNYFEKECRFRPELIFTKKYLLLLFALFLLASKSATAQTSGPNNPNSGTFTAGPNVDWTTPGNITNTADTNYATATFGGAGNTDNLLGSNYAFTIPSNAIINGITVIVNRRTSAINGGRITKDNLVSLVKGGVVTGNNKATATAYGTTFSTATYGSSTDTWGTTWTPSDINATNFGVVFSVNANNSLTATVDYIRVTINYSTIGFSPANACVGSSASVIITGAYIPGTTAVSFNGTAASFVQNSNTQVTATLPAGATTGTISLTTPQGTGTSSASFTVNPLPVLAAITGTNSVCIGSTTTLSNSTPGGTWNSASTGVATINASGVVSSVSAGTSLVTYTYTNGNGCTNSVNTTVTVNALPVVSSPVSVCVGGTAQLTPGSGGMWTSSNISFATIDNTGLVNGIATGSPTFTFTDSTTNCSKTTNPVNVLASPSISSQPIASQTVCSGGSVNLSVTASGVGLSYQWYKGVSPLSNGGSVSGATSTTLVINPIAVGDAASDYHCVVSGTCAPSISSNNAEIIVFEKVTITSNPLASQTFCTGDTATFSVVASGAGLTYQWYRGASALADSGTISGATTSSLSLSTLTIGDAATNYYCVISGTSPCTAVNSSSATLIVNQPPAITTQPTTSQTACSGTSVSISVTATGSNLGYQWYNGATPLANGGSISGATTATLAINPVSASDASANYRCVVNGSCSPNVTSNDAELIVNQAVSITSQPIPTQTICAGGSASFSVGAAGMGLSFQWYKGTTPLTDGGSISGSTSTTLTINPIVLGDAASNYNCVVSGTSPCAAVTSNNTALVVNQLPAITLQPAASQTVCSGNSVSFSVTATGTNLTYQWFNGATPMTNGGSVAGATTATLTVNPVSASDASSSYRCVVSGICLPSVTSNDSALIVNQAVAITGQPVVNQTICVGNTVSFSVAATGTGLSYQWYKGATPLTNGGTISGATSSTLTINPIVAGDAASNYRCVISGTSPCAAATSNFAALVVNQLPTISAQPAASQTVCSGSSVNFSVSATGSNLTFQWYNGATSLSNGGSISGATTATLTINPVSIADASTNYKCVVSGSCSPSVTSNNASLIVNSLSVGGTVTITHTANSSGVMVALPSPVSSYTDCHFSSGILALNGQTGTILRWESSTDAGNTWVNIGGAGSTNFTYTNATVTTTFRAVIQNASCSVAYSTPAILFVMPNIKPTPVSATPSTICAGQFTTLTSLSGFSSSQNVQYGGLFNNANPAGWLVDGNGVFSASADNGNPTTFKETNGNASSEYNTTTNDKFAIARGNLDSTLQTPVFDLIGLTSANLTFNHAHKLVAGAWAKVELSFNGGTTYPVTLATYTGNQGPYNQFSTAVSINLNAYLGYTNLRIRFNYHGLQGVAAGTTGDAWAIDNVMIPQAPVPSLTSLWTDVTANTTVSVTNATNVTVSPPVTTTYAVTSFLNGCTSYGPEGTTYITVTVNQIPAVTASPTTSCSGDANIIPLSSTVAGTQTSTLFNWTVTQTDATGGSSGSGSSINQTLTATGTVQGTVTYTITPTSNGCVGPARTIVAWVNPRPKADIQPSQTICYGGTATLSVTLEGTGPWNLTYSDGVSTTTVNGITASPYVFSVSGMTVNRSFTITALSDSRCSARSQDLTGAPVVTVLNGTPGLWTGLVSTDWFDCKNWAGGLPSSTIDAQIPTTTNSGRMPVIDRTSPFAASYNFIATARDLIVATGASVTMVATNNSELQISRDWKNSGSFIPGTGTVTFNGSTLNQIQNINNAIKINEGFYNLTLNNSNGAKGISLVDGFELTVANELSLLSGDLRLVGEAQIVQNGTTANPSAGTGKILKDQQGHRSSYHYNYWSSPVSSNGTNYTLGGVLWDGTDSATNPFNPSAITFGGGVYFADGALTTPVKLSTSWMYKYTSVSTVYAGWQFIGNTGTVNIGEGFTMKGVTGIAPFTTPQNYVFVGKPNNGTITLNISTEQSYLVGNPYPSALDADEFIKDNIHDGAGRAATNIFNGALYFWDHFGGQTHILNQYIGGYSCYTLMGGVVAISNDPLVNANGSMGTRAPKRYIPVAQGFFIGTGSNSALTGNNPGLSTPVTGGTISFKNSQRAFKIESAANSVFFKSNNNTQTVNDTIDTRQKIRLLFESPGHLFRQILVGVDESATNSFDIGYDAPMIDLNTDDLYWNIDDSKFAIQAVNNFNSDQIIPLGIKTSVEGMTTVKIAALENIPDTTNIFIHDSETGADYDIRNSDFMVALPMGEYNQRFSLRFTSQSLGTIAHGEIDPLIYFTTDNSTLNIKNTDGIKIKTVQLYNILGQFISENKLEDISLETIEIPYKNLPSGTYIVKGITDENKVFCKKIQKK